VSELSLLVPGLLGPLPELAESPLPPVSCAPLQQWLARGRLQDTGQRDYLDQLAALFGVAGDVSAAGLSAQADAVAPQGGQLLRADPVHFRAELDHALLIGTQQLAIQPFEAEALIEQFNNHFSDDGLRLISSHQERWYLHAQQPLQVASVPLHQAMGRNVQHFLPDGEDALRWRKILNEAQMLFFTHDINRQRETRGQLTLNSLWLWGEGVWDEADTERTPPPFDWIMADEVLARGMAHVTGCELHGLDADLTARLASQGHGLLVVDDAFLATAAGDLPGWQDALQRICQHWIIPLHQLLTDKTLHRVHLYSGDGRCYHMGAGDLLKFWRRTRPLEAHVNTHKNQTYA